MTADNFGRRHGPSKMLHYSTDSLGIFSRSGRITHDILVRAQCLAAEAGEPISLALTRLGLASEQEVADIFAESLGLEIVSSDDLCRLEPNPHDLSVDFLKRFHVLPIHGGDEGSIAVAMADPSDRYAMEAIELATSRRVQPFVALATDLEAALDRLSLRGTSHAEAGETDRAQAFEDSRLTELERLREAASDAPVIRLVNQLLGRAVDERASDLHLEPTMDGLTVRLRVDGRLQALPPLSAHLRDPVVSRIKLLANLDIAERRLPQDGRLNFAVRGTEVDFRVATLPTQLGESVVVRVLDRAQAKLSLTDLGFDEAALAQLRTLLALPNGMILVTGPTGSGKTTTLYAALETLNTPHRKLMTVEDPIEYQLAGVQQVQVQAGIGLSFAQVLRSFLRHNPNVVMVGEIRDQETARVTVQVALTGHLVLSTLHTNDAASGLTRLLDMGVEDYLLVSTCKAIVAQRLVRTLCTQCRVPYALDQALAESLGLSRLASAPTVYHAAGCRACHDTGFHGRTTIIEILPLSEAVQALILRRASRGEIGRVALAEGMRSMHAHGMEKVLAGVTTIEEVLGAVGQAA